RVTRSGRQHLDRRRRQLYGERRLVLACTEGRDDRDDAGGDELERRALRDADVRHARARRGVQLDELAGSFEPAKRGRNTALSDQNQPRRLNTMTSAASPRISLPIPKATKVSHWPMWLTIQPKF